MDDGADNFYRARATPTLEELHLLLDGRRNAHLWQARIVPEYLSRDPRDMQLMRDMHFASVMHSGPHPVLSP
jgi:hypothetical protein